MTIAPRRGIAMQYFDQSADKHERLGKVIGDIIAAIVVVGLIVIYVQNFIIIR
jgi:hypothetical protein